MIKMELITNLLFLSVSLIVFLAYRQGLNDSFYIKNNAPLKKTKEEKEAENEFIDGYSRMMNYNFDMAGEVSGDK